MVDSTKLLLEAALLVTAFKLLRVVDGTRRLRFVLGFTAITVALNLVFYQLAAWPLYVSHGQSSGLGRSELQALVLFDVAKWGVLAYVLSQLGLRLQDAGIGGGFALHRSDPRLGRAVAIGIIAGVAATCAIYGLSFAEHRLGYLEALPWPFAKESGLYLKLGLWGGVRNLAGEEIITRLGAQSIFLYVLRRTRGAPVLAVVLSSFFFELWHNGLKEIYFLNFAGSCFFGWAYQKRGYESAAIAHCVADWLALVVLPRVLF